MKFGTAKDLITPDMLTAMGGYHTFDGNTFLGIHDDLYIRALLLDDGRTRLMFVSIELCFIDSSFAEQVKRYARERHGIAEDCVFVSYTHTHSGPATRGYGDPEQNHEPYERFLTQRVHSCIDRALINAQEGTMAYAYIEGDWNINRRRPVNGEIQLAPNPAGAKDNRLHVLKLCDRSGKIKCVLINYACHPVTVRDTPYLSGDFPGRICQLLEAELFGATAVFFQGAGGNARPKLTARGDSFATLTFEEVDEIAVAITAGVKRALSRESLFQRVEADLAAVQFPIPLALEPFTREQLSAMARDDSRPLAVRRLAARVLGQYDELPDEVRLQGGVARLGRDVYVAYMGGEPCYEVKRNLEPLFEDKHLLFIGYADSLAYIPDDRLNVEGGYEASGSTMEYGLKGPFKAGIDRSVEEAFRSALSALRPAAPSAVGASAGGGAGGAGRLA